MAFCNSGIMAVVFQVQAVALTSVSDHNQVTEVIDYHKVKCSKL